MDMLRKLIKRIKDQKGVTLIELLAVIVILGIIAAIAIPNILNLRNDATATVYTANAKTMSEVAKRVIFVKNETYDSTATPTDGTKYNFAVIAEEAGLDPAKLKTEYQTNDTDKTVYVIEVDDANNPGYYSLDATTGDVTFKAGTELPTAKE